MNIKITERQLMVIETLKKHPNALIMSDGYLTGGHGIKLDMRTVRSLETKGLIKNGQLKSTVGQ